MVEIYCCVSQFLLASRFFRIQNFGEKLHCPNTSKHQSRHIKAVGNHKTENLHWKPYLYVSDWNIILRSYFVLYYQNIFWTTADNKIQISKWLARETKRSSIKPSTKQGKIKYGPLAYKALARKKIWHVSTLVRTKLWHLRKYGTLARKKTWDVGMMARIKLWQVVT